MPYSQDEHKTMFSWITELLIHDFLLFAPDDIPCNMLSPENQDMNKVRQRFDFFAFHSWGSNSAELKVRGGIGGRARESQEDSLAPLSSLYTIWL